MLTNSLSLADLKIDDIRIGTIVNTSRTKAIVESFFIDDIGRVCVCYSLPASWDILDVLYRDILNGKYELISLGTEREYPPYVNKQFIK